MPPALRASYVAARQRDGGEAYRFERGSSGGASGRNEAHRVAVALEEGALHVMRAGGDGWHMGLRWTGLGRGARVAAVARPEGGAEVVENRGSYRRADGSEEQYVNGPHGVEQGFVLAAQPAGRGGGAVSVEVTVEGDLAPVLVEGGEGVALHDKYGATVARYTDLAAFDADGVERRSWIEVSGGIIRLRVEDEGARYPLRIDPLMWTQQAELTASDGAQADGFGFSVSMSGDTAIVGASNHMVGGTAIVGAPGLFGGNTDPGAAYVFVRNGTTWTQQVELTASDGANGDDFAHSVSVSGGTAMVGAWNHHVGGISQVGATYVFDFCAISGTAYPTGTTNPSNTCQVCAPGTSTTAWSDQSDGSTCTGGTCKAGVCIKSSSSTSSSGVASGTTNFYGCAAAPGPSPPPGLAALGALLGLAARRRRRAVRSAPSRPHERRGGQGDAREHGVYARPS
jgi:MYXO-CTERM domain-containing protein